MPQFPGGEDSLLNFISKNLKYPNTEDDYMGRVICRFIVNKDGSVSNIEVVRSLETSFDAEAIKVLKLLPNFIPGKQNGNPVRVYYTLPISFKID
jgi:protein TonB